MELLIPGYTQEKRPIDWFRLSVLALVIFILLACVTASIAATRNDVGYGNEYPVKPDTPCINHNQMGFGSDGVVYTCQGPAPDRWRP